MSRISSRKAKDYFESDAEFRRVCGDAQSQAIREWDQEFAADMMIKCNQHGLESYLSDSQLRQLCRIADCDVPKFIGSRS